VTAEIISKHHKKILGAIINHFSTSDMSFSIPLSSVSMHMGHGLVGYSRQPAIVAVVL
jgi:hypothetical protein